MKTAAPLIFGIFMAVPALVSAAPEKIPLTASELKVLLTGNSMAGNGAIKEPAEPYDWIAFYAADGTLTIRLKPEWGGATDTGKWWITEKGEQCRQFTKMGSGKLGCWLFYREDEFYRFVPAQGKVVEGRTAIVKGNLLKPND